MGHLPRCEVESPALVGDVLIIPRIYEQSFSNLRIMVQSFPQLTKVRQCSFWEQLAFGAE